MSNAEALKWLADVESGGDELKRIYTSGRLNNRVLNLQNIEGNFDRVRIQGFDTETGFFSLLQIADGKVEKISGADFYERLKPRQRKALGLVFNILPESDWFKVISKIPFQRGHILTAVLKQDHPYAERGAPYRERIIGQREDHSLVNGFWFSRAAPLIAAVVKKFPELVQRFYFSASLFKEVWYTSYPDIDLVNSIVDSLPSDRATSVRFIPAATFDAVPLKIFAKAWAQEGRLFISEQGSAHFHDAFLHLIAYLAIPPEIALANRAHVDFWLKVQEHPELRKNLELYQEAQNQIQKWATDFDNITGRFLESILGSVTEAEIQESSYLRSVYSADILKRKNINYQIQEYVKELNLSEGSKLLERRYSNPAIKTDDFKYYLTEEEMKLIRAIPLLASPVSENEIPALVKKVRKQLFLAN